MKNKTEPIHEKLMKVVAETTGLQFDGGADNNCIHYDKERVNVFVQHMTKREYSKMCTEINKKTIKGAGFKVYAWNDASSYEYWKNDESGNYIQVTANITDFGKLDVKALNKACEELHVHFYNKYDNTETHFSQAG